MPPGDEHQTDERLSEVVRLRDEGWENLARSRTEGRQYLAAAYRCFTEAEAISREHGDREALVGVLRGIGDVLRATGNPANMETAVRYYQEEVDILQSLRREREMGDHLATLQLCYRDLATAEPERALELIRQGVEIGEKCLTIARKHQDKPALANASANLADLFVLLATHDEAMRESHLGLAADLFRHADSLWGEVAAALDNEQDAAVVRVQAAQAKMGLAEVYTRLGSNLDGAAALLDEAEEAYRQAPGGPVHYQLAQIQMLRAYLEDRRGNPQAAARHAEAGRSIFERLGYIEKPEPTSG